MAELQFKGFGGLRLAAESYGIPDDPGVLLLHGGGQTRAVWRPTAVALAEAGRHVISLDLRGHGDSEWPEDGRYDLDAHLGDLRAVLAELEARPVIVGASLGGWIATAAIGESATQLATGLVLVDAPPHMDREATQRIRGKLDTAPPRGQAWDPQAVENGIVADEAAPRLMAAARNVDVPTLLVRGASGSLSAPGAMSSFAGWIRDVEVVEVADAGQPFAVDQADAFSALVVDFLERRAPLEPPEYRAGSDPRTLRDALGCFATGVTVVTTCAADGTPVGLTANSFTSVSLDPPLLLVCLANTASSLPSFLEADHFAVNVLHIGQQLISGRFASKVEDRFAQTETEVWDSGVPIVRHALAAFECSREAVHEAGDHKILIGRVLRVQFEPRRDPLLYFRGRYRRLHFS